MILKKAIITGATSGIGLALTSFLLKNQYEVISIVRPNSARNQLIKSVCPQSYLLECSLDKLDDLPEKIKGVGTTGIPEEFYHIGWSSEFDNPRYNLIGQRKNIVYTENALRVASLMGCKKFIGIGSQAECGLINLPISSTTPDNPITAYAMAKCETYSRCSELSKEYGINFYWPRLLSEYGPYDNGTLLMLCIDACLQRTKLYMTGAEQIWDYVYVDDVARALFLIMQKGTPLKKYTIASGVGRPLKEYIKIVSEVFDYPKLMTGIGIRPYSINEVMYLVGDVTELNDDTGMTFDSNFRMHIELIRETLSYMRSSHLSE